MSGPVDLSVPVGDEPQNDCGVKEIVFFAPRHLCVVLFNLGLLYRQHLSVCKILIRLSFSFPDFNLNIYLSKNYC